MRVLKALACTRPLRVFASTMTVAPGRAKTGEVAVAVLLGGALMGEVAMTMATTAAMAVAAIRSMMAEVAVPVPVPPVADGERG